MTYVLVSLVGDDVTKEADVFARLLSERRTPSSSFHEPSPSHQGVSAANEGVRRAVIVAHNGRHEGISSLRSHAAGAKWADGEILGQIFKDARVYAYACDTMGARGIPDVQALGNLAHRAGVRAFAGHAIFVDAGWPQSLSAGHRDRVIAGLSQMIFAFLDGEDDAARLKLVARGSFNIFTAGIPLDLSGGLETFQIPIAIDLAVEHLFVAA